ncbi:hypothetical protein [Methylophaga sp.]|uniref:hypothetical protein n=1 Tax=Methylophaga sp. TaxID=2024840 RepID=UPI002722765E|nr:hypothetical protein [Methylophaga sp.]MDO8824973.1 hypothetical protein [Methylophaga sp.]
MRYRTESGDQNRRDRLFVHVFLCVTLLITVLILGLATAYYSLRGLNQLIHNARDWLLLWRLTLLILLIAGWPDLVSRYAEWAKLTAGQAIRLHVYRWRMAGWLLVMELVFCQARLADCAEILIELKAGLA